MTSVRQVTIDARADPGGIVFLAVGVPALLALVTVTQRFRR
jgi:hypothetical protein